MDARPPPADPRGEPRHEPRGASRPPWSAAVGEMVRTSPALAGCAFVLLLVGFLSLLVPFAADDLLAAAVASWQEEVEGRLESEVGDDERTALAWAFQDAIYAVRSGEHDADALARVRQRVKSGDRLDRPAVLALTADLRAVAEGE